MEQNKLTAQLFAEGYSKEQYPDYIKEFNPFYGGFVYESDYRDGLVYLTGCGIEVSGKDVIGTCMYLSRDWSYENFNPLIVCPYSREGCAMNHPLLQKRAMNGLDFCVCHPKENTKNHVKTLQEVQKRVEMRRKERLKEYKIQNAGHYCLNHMYYSKDKDQWCLEYNPMKCEYCTAMDVCSLCGRSLSPIRGNVYYDCRIVYASEDTIFMEETATIIFRAIPVFKTEVSMTICEQVVAQCSEKIKREEFYYPYDMPTLISSENFNVRAMSGSRRDIEQDLTEVQRGVQIIYHEDMTEKIQQQKSKRQKEANQRKVKEATAFVLDNGFENLKSYEKRRILKYLTKDQIEILLRRRKHESDGSQFFKPLEDQE